MSLIHRLELATLQPSPPGPWNKAWVASKPPTSRPTIEEFCLDPDAEIRVQVGGTCSGNAIAQAITTGIVLLGGPRVEVSGTGVWAQGQLWGAIQGADVDPNMGTWVAKALEACRIWGWPARKDHPEENLAALDAEALGEIVARASSLYTFEHRTISESDAKDALSEGWTIVTSGTVDEAFANAPPGGWLDTCISGGGHSLMVDGWNRAGYLVRDTWGRGVGETKLDLKRLHGSVNWMRSRWELRATRVVFR